MGLFGGGGGTDAKSDQTKNIKQSQSAIVGSIFPGLAKGALKDILDASGTDWGSILEGIPGVGTMTAGGQYIAPSQSSGLPTFLPGYDVLSNYDTVFEKFDAGSLSPTGNSIMGSVLGMMGGAGAPDLSKFGSIGGGGGGMSFGGGAGGDIEFNAPPNIGELTQGIYDSMPAPFREFTQRVLDSSDPASFEAELQNFEDKMTTKMMSDIDVAGESVLDVFAAQGLGVGGTAITALKEMAVRGVIETNAVIAAERMKSLEIYTDRLAIGNQIVQILLGAGAQEQANLVQGEVGRMQAEASVIGAQLAAQAQVQSAAMYAQANLQASLANSAVDLYRIQAGLAETAFTGLLGESQQETAAEKTAQYFPYELLTGQSKNTPPTKNASGGLDIGGILGGAGSLIGALPI